MKVTVRGILAFRPFDESAERAQAEQEFMKWSPLAIGLGVAFLLSICSCIAAIVKPTAAIPLIIAATVASLVTAAIEWRLGLRARAGNRLLCTVLLTVGMTYWLR